MQIQSTSSLNFQKVGKLGKGHGRQTRFSLKNPYEGKVKKALDRYKKDVFNTYNQTEKESVKYNLNYFDVAYNIEIADILRRSGARGKKPLEY